MRDLIAIVALAFAAVYSYAEYRGVNLVDVPGVVNVDDKPPVPGDGFHVLIIEETEDRNQLTGEQSGTIFGAPFRTWMKNVGADFRVWDKDVNAARESEWFRKALDVTRQSTPWLIVSNGKRGFSGPLPTTEAGIKAKIQEFAP